VGQFRAVKPTAGGEDRQEQGQGPGRSRPMRG